MGIINDRRRDCRECGNAYEEGTKMSRGGSYNLIIIRCRLNGQQIDFIADCPCDGIHNEKRYM